MTGQFPRRWEAISLLAFALCVSTARGRTESAPTPLLLIEVTRRLRVKTLVDWRRG